MVTVAVGVLGGRGGGLELRIGEREALRRGGSGGAVVLSMELLGTFSSNGGLNGTSGGVSGLISVNSTCK
mgnify:CR=1 FL=1